MTQMHSKEQTAEAQLSEVLDVMEGVIQQACWSPKEERLDSMALSFYAAGIRMLAEYGRVNVEFDYGRRVIATWPDVAEEKV